MNFSFLTQFLKVEVTSEEQQTKLSAIIKDLSPREQVLLEMRFGLVDGITRSLEEVCKSFDVTRERVRQIEAKAIERIQNHCNYKDVVTPLKPMYTFIGREDGATLKEKMFTTINEAVQAGLDSGNSYGFYIVKVIDWEAKEKTN